MAELDRLDREHGLGRDADDRRRTRRRRRLEGRAARAYLTVLVSSVMSSRSWCSRRPLSCRPCAGSWVSAATGRCDPGAGRHGQLRVPADPTADREPVGYDPCRVIEVEVNPSGAPTATNGWSTRRSSTPRRRPGCGSSGSARRTGARRKRRSGRRPPVLVAWASADEVPDLEGDVAGIGGSTAVEVGFRHRRYVTGEIVLDADVFDDLGCAHAARPRRSSTTSSATSSASTTSTTRAS